VIYKNKGPKEGLANYRGIFLSSVVCKIFEKLIYKKVEPIIDMNMTEFQAGARKGRRTTDHILTLKAKIEYDQYLQRDTYIQFYDIVKNQVAIEVFQDRKRLQLHPEKSEYLVNRGNIRKIQTDDWKRRPTDRRHEQCKSVCRNS